ncbi:hypothetical protein [Gordonia sp. GN26]
MKRSSARLSAVLAFLLVVVCGCGDGSGDAAQASVSEPPPQPPGLDVTYQWVGNPVFDPLSPEGTFVRAYVESFILAQEGKSTSWAYPGFVNASPPGVEDQVRQIPSQSEAGGLVGTSTFSLLSREDTGPQTRLVLCEFGYQSTRDRSHGGWFTTPIQSWTTVISFDRSGAAPPSGQKGSARRPDRNVFGEWRVEEFEHLAIGDRYRSEMEGCNRQPLPSGVPEPDSVEGEGSTPKPPARQFPGWQNSRTD